MVIRMKNQLQFRLLGRKIRGSWGRFVAIALIIMLGVLLFVGIKSSGPDLYRNATIYLREQKASDVQLISTSGLTSRDVTLARQLSGAQVQANKSIDAIAAQDNDTFKLISYAKKDSLNQLYLTSGRLPKSDNEIVLDDLARKADYRIGETIKFDQDQLNRQTYRIVGFATSPLYIHTSSRGTTTIGDGTLDYFGYLPLANFKATVYSTIDLRFKAFQDRNSYSQAYQNKVDRKIKQLKKIFKGRATARDREIRQQALTPIEKQQAKLNQAKAQLATAKQQLQTASAGQLSTTPELSAQEEQLTSAQTKLTTAKNKVATLAKTTYYFNDRADRPDFTSYGDLADRIAAIANVFPLIFFLIAVLITFTTITRMVEEERTQVGIFKALGYTRFEISQNYYLYALSATVIGIITGVVIGTNTLPALVISIMRDQYSFPPNPVSYDWPTIAIAILLSLVASLGAVLIVVNRELLEKPAMLMQPRAPKAGKRILLERITPLWRRLTFNQKVSYRNLFRFKSRMWMAILGIAGGTGLILTGIGIRDSIDYSGQTQFNQIINYQAVLTLNRQGKQTTRTAAILNANQKYRAHLPVYLEMVKLQKKHQSVDSVSLYATSQPKVFRRYVKLSEALPQNGALLSRKAAQLLKVKVGDHVTLHDADNHDYQIKVGGITENYAGHFIYMTKAYLNRVTSNRYQPSTWLVKLKSQSQAQEEKLAGQLLKTGEVVNNSYLSTQIDAVDKQTASLRPIVLIFILLSGLLSFIVLYNLTNINVSERIRELSTIKVLGFFDREVTMYIVRENVILTLFGIIVGLGFGNLLTWFILHQAETDALIFPLIISPAGYFTAIVMTIVFTIVVMIVTHFKLKRVDMIEALKANE